jgi:hypothetical protein
VAPPTLTPEDARKARGAWGDLTNAEVWLLEQLRTIQTLNVKEFKRRLSNTKKLERAGKTVDDVVKSLLNKGYLKKGKGSTFERTSQALSMEHGLRDARTDVQMRDPELLDEPSTVPLLRAHIDTRADQ